MSAPLFRIRRGRLYRPSETLAGRTGDGWSLSRRSAAFTIDTDALRELLPPLESSPGGPIAGIARASIHDLIAWRSRGRWGSTLNRTGRRWPFGLYRPGIEFVATTASRKTISPASRAGSNRIAQSSSAAAAPPATPTTTTSPIRRPHRVTGSGSRASIADLGDSTLDREEAFPSIKDQIAATVVSGAGSRSTRARCRPSSARVCGGRTGRAQRTTAAVASGSAIGYALRRTCGCRADRTRSASFT